MHTDIAPELTLAQIALDLGAPPVPAKMPTDPAVAVASCEHYLERCQRLLSDAGTAQERESAELWVWNAQGQLDRWRAVLSRQSIR